MPSRRQKVRFWCLLLFPGFLVFGCASPKPVKLADEQVAESKQPPQQKKEEPRLIVRAYDVSPEVATAKKEPSSKEQLPQVVPEERESRIVVSELPPQTTIAVKETPSLEELLQKVPAASRPYVHDIRHEDGHIVYILRYTVPRGAPFTRTVDKLRKIGFSEEEVQKHIQFVTPEKFTNQYKLRFSSKTPVGTPYLMAGDSIEARRVIEIK